MQTLQENTGRQDKLLVPTDSFGALLSTLAGQSSDLVRDEITLAKQEMDEKFQAYQRPLMLILVGVVLGFQALLILCLALTFWLGEQIGLVLAATLIGFGLAILAIIILLQGKVKLSKLSIRPDVTIKSLEENTEWLKEMT